MDVFWNDPIKAIPVFGTGCWLFSTWKNPVVFGRVILELSTRKYFPKKEKKIVAKI
jgi:hypothetical protein